eukprot:1553815-Pyramimonas_sp.AAC.1
MAATTLAGAHAPPHATAASGIHPSDTWPPPRARARGWRPCSGDQAPPLPAAHHPPAGRVDRGRTAEPQREEEPREGGGRGPQKGEGPQ